MSFFDTISRIIQQGKEMAVKATPSSTLTYNKVTPVDNSQFTSNPLLRDKPLTYQPPVVQQPTFNVPVKAEIPQASTKVAETTPQQTNLTMAQQVSNIIQGGKEAAVLGGGLAKDVARGTTRGAMAGGTFVGARLLGADVNTASQAQFKPKTGLEKFLFGEQPVSVQSEGIAPLESMGVSPDTAKKYGAPFVLGSIALDAFTGGSSKAARRTLEKVAANMTAEDATLLRNLYTKPDVKNVMPRARNEQAIINALKLDKLPYSEQKKAVSNILKEYDKRWGGVDEALNPPVPPNKPGAMDIKKPNVLEKTVLKKTEPLEGEAKKYKSAEEFVKGQGTPVYRATVKDFDPSLLRTTGKGSGLYVTPKKDLASTFLNDADVKSLGEVRKMETLYISPKAKILKTSSTDLTESLRWDYDGGSLTFTDLKKLGGPQGRSDKIVQWAAKNDYDVVVMGDDGYRVIVNPDVVKTRTQLEDIWNKANAKPAPLNKKPNKMADFRAGKPNSEGGYIRNPLAKTPEKSPKDNQVVSSGNDSIKVYHGTNDKFDNFDKTKQKSGYYPGAYTTTDVAGAKKFGSNLIEANIDTKKFYQIKDGGDGLKIKANKAGFETKTANGNGEVEYLKSKGYEGIQRGNEFIIFDPVNLKRQAQLSPIDRLIADNKVRVVSRDGRDVYQVKKGGEWVNKRDEDSAIRAVTPRSPIDIIKKTKTPKFASDATEQRVLAAEIAKEALDADPARQLTKYIAKRGEFKGQLPEVTGKQANKTGVNLDVRAPDLGYADSEEARQAYEAYKIKKVEVENELKSAKEARRIELQTKPIAPVQPKVRQMSRSRDVAWLEREATDRALREQKRIERQTSPAFRSVLDEPTRLSPERVKQLEKSAMPTAEVTRPSTPYKAESLQDIVTKTPLDRKVHIFNYLNTPYRVLNKIGFGKEAKLLRKQYDTYAIELPKNIDKISEWEKRAPDKGASERIFQFLDGKSVKLSVSEQKVADEIKAYLKEWADRLGLPEENRVANYITRLFDDQLIKQEFDEDLAKIISGKIPGEVYNPFLQKRLGAKGYKQDVWGALDAYTKRATRKVHLDPVLERIQAKAGSSLEFSQLEETQFDYIRDYISNVQMRPTKRDVLIDNAVKQVVGYKLGQRPVVTVSRAMRRATYRGMLGGNISSAIRNLSQGINTYAVLGEKYTAIGYAKSLQPDARKELIEQGIFNNNFIEDRVLSSTKKILQQGDKTLFVFFDEVEKINRGAAYFGAKAQYIGKNMRVKDGVEIWKAGTSMEDAIDYAKEIVRKTQFNYDAIDQPVLLGSDIMKTVFQFQTYNVKQIEFLGDLVVGSIKGDKKMQNALGMLRYAVAGYVFVNTVGKALGMAESELVPFFQNITGERDTSVAPSLKFPFALGKAIAGTPDKYGNERDLSEKASDVGKSLIGLIPGGSQMKKTYEGYKAVQEGGSFTKSGNLQFEQGTSKASQIQSILFGKYASQNAKDYFNKKTTTGNKELDKAKKEDQKNTEARSSRADILVASLNDKTKEEKVAYLKELYTTDKDMYDRVLKKIEQKKLNWSKEEKAIADLGVKSGAKAAYVKSQLAKMETKEEKVAYLKDLYERKIISKEVLDQITGTE